VQAAEDEARKIQAELDRMAAESERHAKLQRDQQAMVISMCTNTSTLSVISAQYVHQH
jgi:hypothetical protein